MKTLKIGSEDQREQEISPGVIDRSRRNFLRYAGISSGLLLFASACEKTDDGTNMPINNGNNNDGKVNLGSGDIGVLNYAYALEQLEAAFYTKVVANPYSGMSSLESEYLKDIRNHEIAHREFFKAALGSSAIQALQVDFSSINFSSRDNVLAVAKAFEDLGVAAYNGAGKLITNADYLTIAGKIVSVEARHAALIRDLISNGTFSDLSSLEGMGGSNANGLDGAMSPYQVLQVASTYLKTKLNASNLPKS